MERSISRRTFFKKAGITAGVLVLAGASGAGAVKYAVTEPEIIFPRQKYQKDDGMSKILVTYASKCGSTGEVAVAIAEELRKSNFPVDVLPVDDVNSLDPYSAVILGTALRFEKPLNEMMDFINKFNQVLPQKKIACFSAGVYMRDPTTQNRTKTEKMLEPMMTALPKPVSMAMFGGKVDYKKIAPFWRFLVSMDSSGLMSEGDGRNWEMIRSWARELSKEISD
jgi:menaquinone-dependent protoporphyrinogen oxidase